MKRRTKQRTKRRKLKKKIQKRNEKPNHSIVVDPGAKQTKQNTKCHLDRTS